MWKIGRVNFQSSWLYGREERYMHFNENGTSCCVQDQAPEFHGTAQIACPAWDFIDWPTPLICSHKQFFGKSA